MNNFADYILPEKDYIKKIKLANLLHEKHGIFFDTSVILKTELTRTFIKDMNLEVDSNLIITASLLCCCKKVSNPQSMDVLKIYAKEGAAYLKKLGFDDRFCTICEQVNRYSENEPRTIESDILEVIDNFGGMVLDRPERRGFPIDEALVLLEHRNLKGKNNIFLEDFKKFIYLKGSKEMSYKYDEKNGFRNADLLTAPVEEFNRNVVNLINPIKKLLPEDIRNAIIIVEGLIAIEGQNV